MLFRLRARRRRKRNSTARWRWCTRSSIPNRQAFTEAAAADPQCAIAYWGIAISHRPNPLSLPADAAALKNGLEAVEKGKAIGAKTERERDWLAAIELSTRTTTRSIRHARARYEKAMERADAEIS